MDLSTTIKGDPDSAASLHPAVDSLLGHIGLWKGCAIRESIHCEDQEFWRYAYTNPKLLEQGIMEYLTFKLTEPTAVLRGREYFFAAALDPDGQTRPLRTPVYTSRRELPSGITFG